MSRYYRGMSRDAPEKRSTSKQMRSATVYSTLRTQILHGEFGPSEPLKPQQLASSMGVSLSVVREALQQLIGEGLADRHANRGFSVPAFSDLRWQQIAEARRTLESSMLRMSIERGDVEWEARVRGSHHRLYRTPLRAATDDPYISDEWASAHHAFHRALLDGCGNPVLLETFDRLWTASELARRWAERGPVRDYVTEHSRLEEATLARDADAAADLLGQHLTLTAAALSS
ncbi:GntR family transcriptional regulator [Nonomuraea lactucae]|uniref:GntR family transcriptional regulator n=1 Tax=Nonomuraea lactucae TaxID=2249762 RepID=UPI001F051448|nr:GntR family transcriptional regulator [Nonomuraea lactucae]